LNTSVREGPNLKNNIFLSLVGSPMGLQFGLDRAVIKSRGQGFSPAIMNMAPSYLQRKIEEK